MIKRSFILLSLLSTALYATTPVVYTEYGGLLGNHLWIFCVAKIIATELGYNLHCKPIWGFPNTYNYTLQFTQNKYPWEYHKSEQDIDLAGIIGNKRPRNIRIQGYFQKYSYIKPYAAHIRNDWLKIDPAMLHTIDKDDLVIHVRFHCGQAPVKFEYYQKALSMVKYKQIYLCTDEPDHPYLKQFAPYNPIIKSTRSLEAYYHSMPHPELTKMNIDDFTFMASFNKMIISFSTYAWWAAFLSNATEIYAPYSSTGHTHYGKVDEARYTYIATDIILR